MTEEFILDWWLGEYIPKIKDFIMMNVIFEELTPEELEVKRKGLILSYIDSMDSSLFLYLNKKDTHLMQTIYDKVYEVPLEGVENG